MEQKSNKKPADAASGGLGRKVPTLDEGAAASW